MKTLVCITDTIIQHQNISYLWEASSQKVLCEQFRLSLRQNFQVVGVVNFTNVNDIIQSFHEKQAEQICIVSRWIFSSNIEETLKSNGVHIIEAMPEIMIRNDPEDLTQITLLCLKGIFLICSIKVYDSTFEHPNLSKAEIEKHFISINKSLNARLPGSSSKLS